MAAKVVHQVQATAVKGLKYGWCSGGSSRVMFAKRMAVKRKILRTFMVSWWNGLHFIDPCFYVPTFG